jgi:hypothetical protein
MKLNKDDEPFVTLGNKNVTANLNKAFAGMVKANQDLGLGSTSFIQKRGFNYTGDSNDGWGMRDVNMSFNGASPFGNRELNFSLQPFGLGGTNLLGPAGITPSIFATGPGSEYSRHTRIAHMKIALATEAYKGFGVVKNVIDLMCNFASEDMKIIHPRPAIQQFYRRWAQAVDLQGRTKDIFRAYYKTSNVHVYKTYGEIDDLTYRKMKMSTKGAKDADIVDTNDPLFEDRLKREEKESKKPIGKRQIPWRYTILNPLQMDVKGSKYFGESRWVFLVDADTKRKIEDSTKYGKTDVLDETKINLPTEFKGKDNAGVIELDPLRLYVLHYMKDDHEDWADPMIWPVMNDIMYKNQLRAMDMSVANSVINAITIFKLGDIKNGYAPPPAHFSKLSQMLRTPTYTHNIVWNDAITMESNYPPVEKILSIEKYKSVDRDILAGMGVPSILVDGSEGGNFSNAYLQVRTLLERLEEGRNEVMKWIDREMREIASVMGHRDIPIVKFGSMSLKDENAEKQMIVQLLDRNIISAERVHEVFDIETNIEIERLRNEKKLADNEDIFVKFGPYKDPMNMMDTEQVMELDFKHKKTLEKEKQVNKPAPLGGPPNGKPSGRPPGSKGPQKVARKPKPRGMGNMNVIALSIFEAVENRLTELMLRQKGFKHRKQLELKDREALSELIFHVGTSIPPDVEISNSVIDNALANVSHDDEIDALYKECAAITKIGGRRQHRISTYVSLWEITNEEEE